MNQFAKNLPPKLFIHTKQLRILESVGQGVYVYVGVRCVRCVYMYVCVRCVGGCKVCGGKGATYFCSKSFFL